MKKLGESAPVRPGAPFIAVHIGSGTVGVFLFELLDHLLKEKLKGHNQTRIAIFLINLYAMAFCSTEAETNFA